MQTISIWKSRSRLIFNTILKLKIRKFFINKNLLKKSARIPWNVRKYLHLSSWLDELTWKWYSYIRRIPHYRIWVWKFSQNQFANNYLDECFIFFWLDSESLERIGCLKFENRADVDEEWPRVTKFMVDIEQFQCSMALNIMEVWSNYNVGSEWTIREDIIFLCLWIFHL